MRVARYMAVLAVLATPLAAQDLDRPEDWQVRFDRAGSTEADLDMFVSMPPGWHITSGPAAIYWDPDWTASGEFALEAEIFLFDPGERREAFGVFFGGENLQADDQAYTYFLIRNGGQYIVKERRGSDAPTLVPWTGHDAILSYADRGEDASVRNVLRVEAGAETVRFMVNGEEVHSMPRADLDVDGQVGLRVNHALNLHISRVDITPLM